jgi:hypothetical protein
MDGYLPLCSLKNTFYVRSDGNVSDCDLESPCSSITVPVSISSSNYYTIYILGDVFGDSNVYIPDKHDVLVLRNNSSQNVTITYLVKEGSEVRDPFFTVGSASLQLRNLTINFDAAFISAFIYLNSLF